MSGEITDADKAIEERGFEAIAQEEVTNVVERVGSRSEFYRVITPDIFMGGMKEGFIEMIAVSSRTDAIEYFISNKQKTELIEEINIKLSPQQAKKLARWLIRNLILYEGAFGETVLMDELTPDKLVNDKDRKTLDENINKKGKRVNYELETLIGVVMAGAVKPGNFEWINNIVSKSIGSTTESQPFGFGLITSREPMVGCSEIERATNNGEIMIYGLGGKRGVLPYEVKRRLEISLTRNEIEGSMSGRDFAEIAPQETIASAKSDIILAINEIAKTANIQISQDEKEKLANFSVYLLNKLGSVV